MNTDGPWPFRGTVTWLTPEQGGRRSGPPRPQTGTAYAHTAFVPPRTVDTGLASFLLRGFEIGAWTSPAEGRWLVAGEELVRPGTVVVCTEGARVVAYFQVDVVVEGA